MGYVVGAFVEPIKALYKAKQLLNDNGILLLIAPDGELIYQVGMWEFGNWNPKERWIIFSENQMRKILKVLNFDIVLHRKNLEQRCIGWNDYHILSQRKEE